MPVDPSTPTLSRTRLRLAALMLLLLAATLVVNCLTPLST